MSIVASFTLETAQELFDSNQIIDFDWAWQVLGYARKANAKKTLVRYFEEEFDYFVQPPNKSPESLPCELYPLEQKNSNAGRPTEKIYLTVECFKEMGMLSESEAGKKIRKYFLRCEAIAKESFRVIPKLEEKIEEHSKAIALLQSQPRQPQDFIPPGWNKETWESLPPQDQKHFKYLYRKRNFRPESQTLALPSTDIKQIKEQQTAEMRSHLLEVPKEELQRLEKLKQEMLSKLWAKA
jgi:hypothetical protein